MSDKVHNLKKDYVVQIMNGYDNNEEMPVDTRSQKILRARLAFSDNYEETEESGREAKSLMTKITLLLLLFRLFLFCVLET